MGRIIGLVAVLVCLIVALSFTGCERIQPGHVGIIINMSGSDKGVQNYTPTTGWQFYNKATTMVLQYPTFVQTAKWTSSKEEGSPLNEEISFSSKDGMIVFGDISLSYQLDPLKVPYFYQQFRSDDLGAFTHGFLRNVARDAFSEASNYTVDELYATKRQDFLENVKKRINANVIKYGVIIDQFGFIGAPRLPKQIVDSINLKIKANTDAIRVQNELQISQAEAAKQVAEAEGNAKSRIAEAEGTARANALIQGSASEIVLKLKTIDMQRDAIAKWDGKLPENYYAGAPLPFINVPAGK